MGDHQIEGETDKPTMHYREEETIIPPKTLRLAPQPTPTDRLDSDTRQALWKVVRFGTPSCRLQHWVWLWLSRPSLAYKKDTVSLFTTGHPAKTQERIPPALLWSLSLPV